MLEIRKNKFSFVRVSNIQTTLRLDFWRDFAALFYGLIWSPEHASKDKVYEGSFLIDSTLSGYFETLQCSDLRLYISFAFDMCPHSVLLFNCEPTGFSGLELCSSWAGSGLSSPASTAVPSQLFSGCWGALQSSCRVPGMGLWFPNCVEQCQFDSDLFSSLNMMPDSLFWQVFIGM